MKTFILSICIVFTMTACKKEGKNPPCYDSSIVHDGACPAHCPGFEGCDGKTYCNECEAARKGIGPK